MTPHHLELATAGESPFPNLPDLGWRIVSGPRVSATVERYRDYVVRSRGEWSIAKNCYVATRTGWFSDRTAAYLALGRPAVVQSTGFESWLPVGRGVLPFIDAAGAVAALDAVVADYAAHARAARELLEAYFDARTVLSTLVETAMNSLSPARPDAASRPRAAQ